MTKHQHPQDILKKLSSVVEQTADNVFITNCEGVIEYVNAAFEQLTGYSRAEAIGQTPRFLKSGRHDAAFYHTLWQTILAGEVYRAVITNRKKSGAARRGEAGIRLAQLALARARSDEVDQAVNDLF